MLKMNRIKLLEKNRREKDEQKTYSRQDKAERCMVQNIDEVNMRGGRVSG